MQDNTTRRRRAVLWDMDGTLVDTEPHWMAAQRRLAREHSVEWTDAERLLEELAAADIPCALVTMAYSPVAHRVTAAAPGNAFAAVVAGDDVERGKPHPDPYLQAAALGVPPEECADTWPALTSRPCAPRRGTRPRQVTIPPATPRAAGSPQRRRG